MISLYLIRLLEAEKLKGYWFERLKAKSVDIKCPFCNGSICRVSASVIVRVCLGRG